MSVQLILYPQDYSGYSFSTTPILNEYVSDWELNGSLVGAACGVNSLTSNFLSQTGLAICCAGCTPVVGGWKGWHISIGGGYWAATGPPEISGGKATLTCSTGTPSGSLCSIVQKITTLTQGQSYQLSIVHNGTAGDLIVGVTGFGSAPTSIPDPLITSTLTSAGTLQVTFTANSQPWHYIMVTYNHDQRGSIEISSISITEDPATAPSEPTDLNDGQVICDLYAEEDIPLTLSVDDFTNIAEKVQSYSKDFNLPNTKRNSKIFTHIFDVTKTIQSTYDFNPYAKTRAVLKQDGILIFEGSLRLIDIQDQEGEISYNVNLYSEAIALSDTLKDRRFGDMDFGELAHDYDKVSIKSSWDSTGLPLTTALPANSFAGAQGATNTQVLKYPFVNWTGDIMIANGFTGNTSVVGYPELQSLQEAFRPFIQLKYLINRIFKEAGYSFTSEFFDTTHFENLFMDFNWGTDNVPNNTSETGVGSFGITLHTNNATTSFTVLELESVGLIGVLPPNYNTGTNVITATTNNEFYYIDYRYQIQNTDSSAHPVELQWLHSVNGAQDYSGVISVPANSTITWSGSTYQSLISGGTLQAQFKTDAGGVGHIKQLDSFDLGMPTSVTFLFGSQGVTGGTLANTLRGELNQWDFFKGIITMFNLITMPDPDNPNNILIEPYPDVFGSSPTAVTSKDLDWTYKVDISDMKLSPLDLKKNVIFKYEEDEDDYAFRVYKNATSGYLYGSKDWDGATVLGTQESLVVGEEEIIAEPYAATVCKPLGDLWTDFVIPAIYSSNAEGTEFEGYDNLPRILYNNGKIDSGITYYIPAQNGQSSENQAEFLQFTHLSAIPSNTNTTLDYNFGACQLIGLGLSPVQNLFYLHYQEYFNELYSPDSRTMTVKVLLNASDINTFKFYDKVTIKNRQFKVNKIDYKPNELSTVEFILI